ncbi:pilus assembly protein PilV [Alteromonas sp. C1M14]|uniref:type IV pilus modification PilV family protein n=1 Tax=Alteromonas sp. C1M14 TaxID=2841567 RepID=UPI001C0987FA|nr:pilus assembly protein PilV [Alteromonas sp. C1M14]MBU2979104.1 pilus assembly protein PilV [Alteromonas sp. C1M14]
MRQYALEQHQSGVGFIEVLITLFVLAIGLLGVASLQFVGSFANRDAISRTQSELVAEQVAERLRTAARPATASDSMVVNNAYFTAENYNFATLSCADDDVYACHCLSRPASIPDCEGGNCSEAQMAQYDSWALSCAAVQTNQAVTLQVTCTDSIASDTDTCSSGSRIHIILSWPVSNSTKQKYTLNARCNADAKDSNACVVKDITL